ncbi:FAD-dependent oxidoreductase [Methylophaga pinxianii]|uniref:FAD-dependent oxidoreductase n=1 Tax=Methylophaga pinxianii TaxID=2881052 RepID=UPI001CF268E5|nr:FAD-dependent oxidoreductase [Methylophaga pinxianii]MCB2426653.1 (2Fe-2S)-binding protein [Methylophaga pinxianii]UPH45087.1 2Fe-2S iron-sulfur cluster-binding protein [Methylophaga pinxianii]
MSSRLINQPTEWIDRDKPFSFTYEGQKVTAFEGDTISSALWANGIRVLGRSFKYHRARGILTLANHDVNALMTDGLDTNIRADVLPVQADMTLTAVNTTGGVLKDRSQFIDKISPLLPVGFYYKAFHTPRRFFPFWEDKIRKAAGLGEVNFNYPRIPKPKQHAHCDVLIIGAGISGLSAALSVAEQGLSVIIVDENAKAGGSLTYDMADQASSQLAELLNAIEQHDNIRLITNAYAAGYYADHLVPIVETSGITKVRAKALIVASGAFEQPPVFRNNDLPGVMMGSAAQRLIYRYAVKPFEKGVVVTANDYGYRTALDLVSAGVDVLAVIDMRREGSRSPLIDELKDKQVAVHKASCVYEVIASKHKLGVSEVVICAYDELMAEADTKNKIRLKCDGVAMSAGWAPAAALLYQAGTKMRFDSGLQQFVPAELPEGVFAAGKVNGVFELSQRALDGQRAAAEAMNYLGKSVATVEVKQHQGTSPSHAYPVVNHPKGKNFVDFDEDIQVKDFINAAKEGFDNIELMKRFTTVGMGPSQGKHSNMNAIRILARIRDLPVEKIGTTTARPFFHPTPIGHLGGRGFHPHRYTAMHEWHIENGGQMTAAGLWMRPACYLPEGCHLTAQQATHQEAMAVRTKAGIIDNSTLGKIEVYGPDAAAFLERVYTGKFVRQKVGQYRIAMLLDEAGVMVDDGLACRLEEDRFYLTTSTTNSAMVYRQLQREAQLCGLSVSLANLTGAKAAMTIAGPAAAEIISQFSSVDLAATAFPTGSVVETQIADIECLLLRVAFVAEQAFEIHLPAAAGLSVWSQLMQAGQPFGLQAYGTDAQRLLRLEMGHHLIGHDTDGLTNPFEAHAEPLIAMDKTFFTGQRSLQIIAKKPLNKTLVNFVLDSNCVGELPNECNLVIDNGDIAGRITSIAFSPYLQRVIGIAFVPPEKHLPGSRFDIRNDAGDLIAATVIQSPTELAKSA